MKLANSITISVFAKPDEDEEAIRDVLAKLTTFDDLGKEKIFVKKTVADGLEKKIVIYEIVLHKERHTSKFIDNLKTKLSKTDLQLLANQENRIDDDCFFYLRLGKEKLLQEICELTEGGDCFHVKMSLAAFPKKRQVAIELAKRIFSQ